MKQGVSIKAYSAGLVDGEGSIQINLTRNQVKKAYFNLTVQISNNDLPMMEFLMSKWEMGSITKWKGKEGKRDSYNWRLYSAQAEKFLRAIKPYLVTKKRQAEIVIEFRQHVKKQNTGRGFTEFQLKERKRLAIEIRKLNIRGGHGRPVPKSWEEVI